MIVAGLLYLGMFALASGMSRHAPLLLGRWHARLPVAHLPFAGWGLILLALVLTLLGPDWPRALVLWFGLLPLAGGVVLLSLSFAPPLARTIALIAIVLEIIGLAGIGAAG